MIFGFTQHIFNTLDFGAIQLDRLSQLKQGVSIGILGISVVFMGLITLFVLMKLFIYASNYAKIRKKKIQKTGDALKLSGDVPVSGEVATAISMAIHQSREEFHDMEETIITLQRITKPYSPWSSKIHVLRRPAR